ncbi:type IV pilus secretin PilQ [Alkalilimnicola sp. S0819]|nr:type IV pilus secretin PilQ [Alkalilimnicola sp. S0819]MPQ16237.1 type IV pilus secretin PilQ [Alkalilimnicola sp. S0819]
MLLLGSQSAAAQNALTDIDFSTLPGNRVQLTLSLENPTDQPRSFTIEDPARIALDLLDTENRLSDPTMDIGAGNVESVTTAAAGGRTRVVIKLAQLVGYETRVDGNRIHVLLDNAAASTSAAASGGSSRTAARTSGDGASLKALDFRRTAEGTARIILSLSDPNASVDLREEGGQIIAEVRNSTLPDRLARRLDVTDFATPVETVDARQSGRHARITVSASGDYEQLAYQTGDTFVIEVQPLTAEEQAQREREETHYTGERLSLNFQDIEVRSVLQLLADFTGLNLVVSDSVTGNITLRLQNVPWDQALDIILRTRGLDKRQNGNVMLIAPAEEIAARERLELESRQQVKELAPLRSELLQVSYAKAQDIATLLQSGEAGLISERGSLIVDPRTNTLILRESAENLSAIRALVTELDIPVKQVLIESRIVIASDDFSKDLGVRFGVSGSDTTGNTGSDPDYGIGGRRGFPAGNVGDPLMVDLPVVGAGNIGLAIGRIGSWLLQLELSAMEAENRGDIVSSPRVITADKKSATIEQGVEIPYLEASSAGNTSVSFKKAVLGLTVTPQITPDDRVLLDLEVSKDSVGETTLAGPAINTQSVTTQVLVDNGETVVLGGVYERTNRKDTTRVPFFGELPAVGYLFRSTNDIDARSELLVFVTPKILKESLSVE